MVIFEPQGIREQNVWETLTLYDYRRADSSAVVPHRRVINCMLRVCVIRYEVHNLFSINFIQC
jgi:hypothetical protein